MVSGIEALFTQNPIFKEILNPANNKDLFPDDFDALDAALGEYLSWRSKTKAKRAYLTSLGFVGGSEILQSGLYPGRYVITRFIEIGKGKAMHFFLYRFSEDFHNVQRIGHYESLVETEAEIKKRNESEG